MVLDIFTILTGVSSTDMAFKSMVDNYLAFDGLVKKIHKKCSNRHTVGFYEFDETGVKNKIYEAAMIYLGYKLRNSTQKYGVKVSMRENSSDFEFRLDRNGKGPDFYGGHKFKWVRRSEDGVNWFEFTYHKNNKNLAFDSYLPSVLQEARNIQKGCRKKSSHIIGYFKFMSREPAKGG